MFRNFVLQGKDTYKLPTIWLPEQDQHNDSTSWQASLAATVPMLPLLKEEPWNQWLLREGDQLCLGMNSYRGCLMPEAISRHAHRSKATWTQLVIYTRVHTCLCVHWDINEQINIFLGYILIDVHTCNNNGREISRELDRERNGVRML